ncbi:YolD-like family protein [Paenibacillus sp. WQ 127069]|uniref:YolD-like family protein n=1 Tax=Paenibacillus baimaensis TaxID=2982185 RepID=A0ABT2UEL2_9BACL|nr:YolD-like family protein [Paenibacillus sp. WQ 127069]MCU6793045.1 YolD-like family protein [Paenibacillus sp. WQ 127069]
MNLSKHYRPELTEKEQSELFGRLSVSQFNNLSVKITLFGEYEDRRITGIVTGIDPRHQLIKIETTGTKWDWHLIDFANVVEVEFE